MGKAIPDWFFLGPWCRGTCERRAGPRKPFRREREGNATLARPGRAQTARGGPQGLLTGGLGSLAFGRFRPRMPTTWHGGAGFFRANGSVALLAGIRPIVPPRQHLRAPRVRRLRLLPNRDRERSGVARRHQEFLTIAFVTAAHLSLASDGKCNHGWLPRRAHGRRDRWCGTLAARCVRVI